MSKKKNPAGLQSRVNQRGVIEVWLGKPDDPESDCLAQFDGLYLESVLYVLGNIDKSPRYEGNMHYPVRNKS